MSFSPDGTVLVTGGGDGTVTVWGAATGQEIATLFFISGSVRIGKSQNGGQVAQLVSLTDGTWVVATPDGRFDTNNLEESRGAHWVVPDDPLRALPLEIFMRDYYEPRLLARVLAGERLAPIRSLATLNRAQPKAEIVRTQVEDAKAGTVLVTVAVTEETRSVERDGTPVVMKSGAYDLRLFREGQLVGQWHSPAGQPVDPDRYERENFSSS